MTSELEANPAVLLEVSAQRTVKRGVNSQQLRPLLATAFPGSCSTSARISNVRVARPCRICRPWRCGVEPPRHPPTSCSFLETQKTSRHSSVPAADMKEGRPALQ